MLRLACRLGSMTESFVTNSCLAASSGALRLRPTAIGGFQTALKTSSFTKDTGLKPSLTLFLLFMARRMQAP